MYASTCRHENAKKMELYHVVFHFLSMPWNYVVLDLSANIRLWWMIQGCETVEKPPDFDETAKTSASVIDVVHRLNMVLSQLDPADFPGECGRAVTVVTGLADRTHMSFHFFYTALANLRAIFSCENFNPLYTGVMYDGESQWNSPFFISSQLWCINVVCTQFILPSIPLNKAVCINGVNGLAWIFSSALCMAICCMIMVRCTCVGRAGAFCKLFSTWGRMWNPHIHPQFCWLWLST